jgi:1-phosphatidylinositol phosphodiesterase
MRWVPDSTPLSLLSIPGTHDTMAHYGGPLAQTQSLPLRQQLRAGIRALDIRARHVQDRFSIYHGIIYQNAGFSAVLQACNEFLEQNPTETILLWLSADGVPEALDNTRSYYETFQWYRDQSGLGGRIATNVGRHDHDTPLGQVRGKIVIIQGFYSPSFTFPYGYGLDADDIPGNDYWNLGDYSDMPAKWAAVLGHALTIEIGTPSLVYNNSLDGSSDRGGIWPIDVANGILGQEGIPYRYLKFLFAGAHSRTTGLVYMDFPGSGLIGAIIAHNMKFASNVSVLASDFPKVMKDISYSATSEGDDEAVDRARQIKTFLEHILPEQHWSVLGGRDIWGIAIEPGGLFGQSDDVDGYSHVAVSTRNLDASITTSQILSYMTLAVLTPLNGEVFMRAAGARALLKAQFPQVRWNVAVKQAPFDSDRWSAELSAVASASLPVVDDGAIFVYTVWATSNTNFPPVAVPGGPYVVNEGSPVTFNASQSTDFSDVLQFRWDFDGDGIWDTDYSYSPMVTHTYADDPAPVTWLEVFDGASRSIEKVSVSVLNVVPSVEVPGPIALGSDRTLSREFTIVDPGSDSWTVNVRYGDGTPAVNPILVGRTFTLNHQFPASGYFEVTIDVRDDDDGQSVSAFRVITGAPALDIQRLNATTARVSWSNHPAPFRLETSTHPSSFNWQTVTGTPTLLNGRKQIDITSTNAQGIFRLALP